MRSLTAALLYPAIGMLEFSDNYSVGRGTDRPFEMVGAKWIHGRELAADLNSRQIPGIRVYPIEFRPDSNKYAGTVIEGVQFLVIDRTILETDRLGLELAAALQHLYAGQIRFDKNRRLIGNNEVIEALEKGKSGEEILLSQRNRLEEFRKLRLKYLLYQ